MRWFPLPILYLCLEAGSQRIKNHLIACKEGEKFCQGNVLLAKLRDEEDIMAGKTRPRAKEKQGITHP
jgi:hypothetical protein